MSIKEELDNLHASFDSVARAIEKDLPQIWAEAIDIWKEPKGAAEFLIRQNPYLEGKSPVDVALELQEGEERVIAMLKQIQGGVYL